MNARLCLVVVALLLLSAAASPHAERAVACAVAPPRNKQVQIADETAIILWDPASKTEHFIRQASFSTDAQDFGFLVPTPSKPTLEEANRDAFSLLATITAPRVVKQSRPSGGGGCGCAAAKAPKGAAGKADPGAVRVLDEKRVAGLDAAVLEADDAKALTKWLGDHGYQSSPALTDWLAPYIKDHWKVSAFKIARVEGKKESGAVGTTALRMTFKTDRPFFPYREPASQRDPTKAKWKGKDSPPSRLLRVYFLGEKRMQGEIQS
jgi:hypothetical protein